MTKELVRRWMFRLATVFVLNLLTFTSCGSIQNETSYTQTASLISEPLLEDSTRNSPATVHKIITSRQSEKDTSTRISTEVLQTSKAHEQALSANSSVPGYIPSVIMPTLMEVITPANKLVTSTTEDYTVIQSAQIVLAELLASHTVSSMDLATRDESSDVPVQITTPEINILETALGPRHHSEIHVTVPRTETAPMPSDKIPTTSARPPPHMFSAVASSTGLKITTANMADSANILSYRTRELPTELASLLLPVTIVSELEQSALETVISEDKSTIISLPFRDLKLPTMQSSSVTSSELKEFVTYTSLSNAYQTEARNEVHQFAPALASTLMNGMDTSSNPFRVRRNNDAVIPFTKSTAINTTSRTRKNQTKKTTLATQGATFSIQPSKSKSLWTRSADNRKSAESLSTMSVFAMSVAIGTSLGKSTKSSSTDLTARSTTDAVYLTNVTQPISDAKTEFLIAKSTNNSPTNIYTRSPSVVVIEVTGATSTPPTRNSSVYHSNDYSSDASILTGSTKSESDGLFQTTHTPPYHTTSDDNSTDISFERWTTESTDYVPNVITNMTFHFHQMFNESTSKLIAVRYSLNNSESCSNETFTVSLLCAYCERSQLEPINISVTATYGTIRFTGLQSAHVYWLTTNTSCQYYQGADKPKEVYTGYNSDARCENLKNDSLTISFMYNMYDVLRSVCLNAVGIIECNGSGGNWKQVPSENNSTDFMNLSPYTEYSIIVSFNASYFGAINKTITCRTTEAKPEKISFLNVSLSNSNEAIVTWVHPRITNGNLTGFELHLRLRQNGENSLYEELLIESANKRSHTYRTLVPGSYEVSVSAKTSAGTGPPAQFLFTVPDTSSSAAVYLTVILSILLVLAVGGSILLYVMLRHPNVVWKPKSREDNGTAMKVVFPTKPVRAEDFVSHVLTFARDSGLMFNEEFEGLKSVGREQYVEQAELQCNRVKNRFTNILPYDHSRVKLIPMDDMEGSDYINANWIPGYNSKREYIASQGPLHSTKDDFWRMVWEYNCKTIVMLTLCVENQRVKCEQYWPMDSEPLFYGDLQISITHETKTTSSHIRDLQICFGEQVRNVRHFHYIEWPDMKVPDTVTMLEFVRTVRAYVDQCTGPLVVHCSAGVGRTGTFIALDVLLQQLKLQNVLDVYGVVYKMRMNRVLMVQTEQQYVFIYECLKYAISCSDNSSVNANYTEENEITDTESVQQDSNSLSTDE